MNLDVKLKEILQKEAEIRHNYDGRTLKTVYLFPGSDQVDKWITQTKKAFAEAGYEHTNAQFYTRFYKEIQKIDFFDELDKHYILQAAKRAAGLK